MLTGNWACRQFGHFAMTFFALITMYVFIVSMNSMYTVDSYYL